MASFDFIAPVYDFLAKLIYGKSIHRAQIHFLNQIPNQAHVLILGGGTGWILEAFPNQNSCIDYVDPSKGMLKKARRRKVSFSGLRFIQGTEKAVKGQLYDVVITPFVLDVCNARHLPQMTRAVGRLVKEKGLWICVDFNAHDHSLKARFLGPVMCVFFRIVSGLKLDGILPYFEAIEQTGFAKTETKLFYGRFIQASLFKRA